MLLGRRLIKVPAGRFDVAGHLHQFDVGEMADLVLLAPAKEPSGSVQLSRARVPVADSGAEGREEPAIGMLAGIGAVPATTKAAQPSATLRARRRTVSWPVDSPLVARYRSHKESLVAGSDCAAASYWRLA